MTRRGIEFTVENIEKSLDDIAGVRVICAFMDDIYMLRDCLVKQDDVTVLLEKDYIRQPKDNGYRSLHLILEIPIFLTNEKRMTRVEVQFRTIAMDFWASLEHKIYYKFEGNAPEYISRDLQECADIVSMLDDKMLQLNNAVGDARDTEFRVPGKKKYIAS
jgi:putative GTP pyrophosphokinase